MVKMTLKRPVKKAGKRFSFNEGEDMSPKVSKMTNISLFM